MGGQEEDKERGDPCGIYYYLTICEVSLFFFFNNFHSFHYRIKKFAFFKKKVFIVIGGCHTNKLSQIWKCCFFFFFPLFKKNYNK